MEGITNIRTLQRKLEYKIENTEPVGSDIIHWKTKIKISEYFYVDIGYNYTPPTEIVRLVSDGRHGQCFTCYK